MMGLWWWEEAGPRLIGGVWESHSARNGGTGHPSTDAKVSWSSEPVGVTLYFLFTFDSFLGIFSWPDLFCFVVLVVKSTVLVCLSAGWLRPSSYHCRKNFEPVCTKKESSTQPALPQVSEDRMCGCSAVGLGLVAPGRHRRHGVALMALSSPSFCS